MNVLEYFYDINFHKIDFAERKKSIVNQNTIIQGAAKTGKSYLVYDYLSKFNTNEYLYIDFNELKIKSFDFWKDIEKFILLNNIKILALDNFDFDLKLPKCNSIIITTNQNQKIKKFYTITLFPLDFEEFLLFDKHQNITTSFNFFLKYGNFIQTVQVDEQHKSIQLQNHIKLLVKEETTLTIIKYIFSNGGEIKSLNQLYLALKKNIKISKDRFYKYCKELEDSQVVFFLKKYNQPKAAKKIYIYNHALLSEVSFKKNFNNIFANMIYLELNRQGKEIYYDNNIDFYLPKTNEIILSIPFFTGSQISSKVINFIDDNGITKITLVKISNEQDIYLDNIECEVNPFYIWAVE